MSSRPSAESPRRFHAEPLILVLRHLEALLSSGPVSIDVPDPDLGPGRYPGERVEGGLVHRPLRSWCDLAEGLSCRLRTPRGVDATHVRLTFEPLGSEASWHAGGGARTEAPQERYGAASDFARVRKFEDAGFLLPWLEAVGRLALPPGARLLDLGVNRGDELAAFAEVEGIRFVGVDHSASALLEARAAFPDPRHAFIQADLNALPSDLGRFDVVVSVGTLQSPGVDDRALLRTLVQEHLEPKASLVLGFPNSRFRDGEVVYGARVRNLREPDLSLLVKDLSFYRRYLHQHGFRTFLGGKYDLLLTAVRGQAFGSDDGGT
ncbi:class I SAM-dependent methyltransferase [Corallococcus sp. AB011P]|uniref:class I SAM-dependent methyltransferase n=1 Tax=unclassified Corallococcus TaxID=2685029 RepID=UPI000EA011B5|nr:MULTISPECIES: class I SAM-dependent methyltransferase [unclassified Corallococcus]RKG59625.1 class I SAM-dependent methyltransferase [Corallococcus sp. AB011P]RKH78374.1 class I SAM-dependent methyltransferase [Corallococcus sp. AB045]